MKQVYVGGQLLGRRSRGTPPANEQTDVESNFLPWQTFSPLITPAFRNNHAAGSVGRQTSERFILLPSLHFVTVLAYKTGKKIAYLVPSSSGGKEDDTNRQKNDSVLITSATLATFPVRQRDAAAADLLLRQLDGDDHQKDNKNGDDDDADDTGAAEGISDDWADDQVLLIGCNDGTIQEFPLNILTQPATYQQKRICGTMSSCGPYHLSGICLGPRRVTQISKQHLPIIHLSSVNINSIGATTTSRVALYAIVSDKQEQSLDESDKEQAFETFSLHRILLTRASSRDATENSDSDSSAVCVLLHQFQYQPHSTKFHNKPFHLAALLRDDNNMRLPYAQEQDSPGRPIVFVVVAHPKKLSIYCDYLTTDGAAFEETLRFPPVVFYIMEPTRCLASVAVSTNGTDIACGQFNGEIRILCDVFTAVAEYYRSLSLFQDKVGDGRYPVPKHPSESIITRNIHWHAHPVASLAYQSTGSMVDPMLYSGGEESVLVTWQLSRGTYRPSNVLPRLAKGGIVNIQIIDTIDDDGGPSGILVACEDNTLQLFESHNRSLKWKVQGLAYRSIMESLPETPAMKAKLWADPRGGGVASLLVLAGLPDAPGYIHWYDTAEQRVSRVLEVAPFNRVSKVERQDSPLPSPAITHCAFSASGGDLVTVDVTPTENKSIGAFMHLDERTPCGTVSTIKFWSYNNDKQNRGGGINMPYQVMAAMTFPHGPENLVSALAVSRDGKCCCSVSNGEKAIRIWHKTTTPTDEDDEGDGGAAFTDRRRPIWVCRYRITSPSGFSNMTTRAEGVAFSTDGSILAICYGNMITLWDHHESSFLTSLLHLEDDRVPIDSIQFLPLDSSLDMILTKSVSGVALQSPFARCGVLQGWSWMLPADDTETIVTDAHVVLSQELVAISMYCRRTNQSRVIFVDVVTGNPTKDINGKQESLAANIAGSVLSMNSAGSANARIMKHATSKKVQVNVLTNQGELVTLETDDDNKESVPRFQRLLFEPEVSQVPKFPDWLLPNATSKRSHTIMMLQTAAATSDTSSQLHHTNKRLALANFGNLVLASNDGESSTPVPTTELPSLSGGFARAFVGRNLVRHQKAST